MITIFSHLQGISGKTMAWLPGVFASLLPGIGSIAGGLTISAGSDPADFGISAISLIPGTNSIMARTPIRIATEAFVDGTVTKVDSGASATMPTLGSGVTHTVDWLTEFPSGGKTTPSVIEFPAAETDGYAILEYFAKAMDEVYNKPRVPFRIKPKSTPRKPLRLRRSLRLIAR
jgi:hypothetical protein